MRIAPRRYGDSVELSEIERRLAESPTSIEVLFERACCLEDIGRTEAAVEAYVAVLQRDFRHLGTLTNLGSMLLHRGDAEKARQFFTQALTHHPLALITHINLGHALVAQQEIASATSQYQAALAVDAEFFAAHHALALLYESTGDAARAEHHWAQAFAKHASTTIAYAGTGTPPVRLLLVISGRGGDIVVHRYLDSTTMETTIMLSDAFRSSKPLAPHDVVFNAIGDADRCRTALERAEALLAASTAPVINAPSHVLATGRAMNAQRLGAIPGVAVARTELVSRTSITAAQLAARKWTFPLLVRAPGHQEGRHFELVAEPNALPEALARLPGDELFVIAFMDTRGADGFLRKYRMLFIDGRLYPVHLAVSSDWKVHYFSSDMSERADHRDEERAFLDDPRAALGAPVMTALEGVCRTLGLDYGGADFAITADGKLAIFEANATMAVFPPPDGEQWAYRRSAYEAVVTAVRAMISARANT
jgi:tetratricopeptide (TPR) repeat protein